MLFLLQLYDTIRYCISKCAQKLTGRQVNLPCGTGTEKITKRTKNKTNTAKKKRSKKYSVKSCSPEGERETMVGRICERGVFKAEGERVMEYYRW